MSNVDKFKALVMDVFGIGDGDFTDDKTPEDLENWTSVTHMALVAKFEEAFGFQFDVEDITEMDSLGNMKKILRKYKVDV